MQKRPNWELVHNWSAFIVMVIEMGFYIMMCVVEDDVSLIAMASFVSFLAGSFVNAYVMSRMKIADRGKRFPLRAIMSTIWGEGADSLLFFPLAFYGVLPNNELPLMMLSQLVLKTVYEIIVLPVTIRVVHKVKTYEGEDTYDDGISYNIFAVFTGRNGKSHSK